MTDKYKDLRDALAAGTLALNHVAVAETEGLRWLSGRKIPGGVSSIELHSISGGGRAHGCVAVNPETIRALIADADRVDALEAENAMLRDALRDLIQGYVNALDCARDRIKDLGGNCDPVSVMEAGDPHLRAARAALAQEQGGSD